MADIGSVSVSVVPNATNFATDFRAKALPAMGRVGEDIGDVLTQRINAKLQNIVIDPRLADTQVMTAIDRLRAQIDSLADGKSIKVDVDGAKAMSELAEVAAQAQILSDDKVTVGVDVDAGRGEAQLAAFMAQLELTKGAGDALDGLLSKLEIPNLQVSSDAVFAAFLAAAGDAAQATDDLGSALSGAASEAESLGSEGASAFTGLLGKIKELGLPAAIGAAVTAVGPLTAAAVAGGTEIAGLAGVAALAYEGMKTQMSDATNQGVALKSGFGDIGTELQSLEATAATALDGGVLDALGRIKTFLPTLDPIVGSLGGQLSTALGIGTGGLISGITALEPLLDQAGDEVVALSTDFANFAASPRFAQFVAYAQQELPIVVGDIGDVGEAALNLITTLQPAGDTLLKTVDAIVKGINDIHNASQAGGTQPGQGSWLNQFVGALEGKGNIASLAAAGEAADKAAKDAAANLSSTQTTQADATAYAAEQQTVLQTGLSNLLGQYQLTGKQADAYTSIVGHTSDEVSSGTLALSDYAADLGNVTNAYSAATATGNDFLAALQTFSQSEGTAADKAALIGATLKASQGDLLSYSGAMVGASTANQQFVTDFDNARFAARDAHQAFNDAKTGVVDLTTGTLNYHNAAAGPLISDLQALQTAADAAATATYQHELATKGASQAASDATDVFQNDTHGALIAEATQLGLTRTQADKLATSYFSISDKDLKSTVEAEGLDSVNDTLDRLGDQLALLTGTPWDIDVRVAVSNNVGQAVHDAVNSIPGVAPTKKTGASKAPAKAGGGDILGVGTGTSDSNLIWASRGEFMSTEASASLNHAALAAGNQGARLMVIPGFADGGFVGVTAPVDPQVAKSASAAKTASTAAAKKAATAATQLAKQNATIKVSVTSDVTKVLGSVLDSVDAVQSSFSSLLADVSSSVANGVGSKSLITTLEHDNNQLSGLAANRAGILDQLTAAQNKYAQDTASYNQEKASVSQGITSNLGITSLTNANFDPFGGVSATGSVADSIATLQGRVQQSGAFQKNLATLAKMGLSPALIQQLADAGVSGGGASAAQLVGGSKAQIAEINSLSGQVNAFGGAAGTQIAKSEFAPTIRGDINAVNTANSALIANQVASANIASGVVTALKGIGIQVSVGAAGIQQIINQEITKNNTLIASSATYR